MNDHGSTPIPVSVEPGHTLAELSGLLMVEVDDTQRIRWMSPTASHILNGAGVPHANGATISQFLPGPLRERGTTLFHRFARHRARRDGRIVLPLRTASGETRAFAWCVHRRSAPELEGRQVIVCWGRPIDGRRGGAASLLTSSDAETLAVVLHELNQPLAAIANFSAACLERLRGEGDIDAEAIESMMRQIQQQAERAGEFLRQMRGAARQRPEAQSRVDLSQAVRDALMIVAHDADRLGVETRVSARRPSPSIDCDPAALQQVLVNLIRNAVEAAAERHSSNPRIVQLDLDVEDDAAVLSVDDSGPGVSPDVLPRLFEPFVTRKPGGMGVGLSIAGRLARSFGGTVAYDGSSPLGGARFTCRVPHSSGGSHEQQ